MPEMTAVDVTNFLDRMEKLGIKIWVVGGWGVDALLGVQTRPHDDLDIVIQRKDTERARRFLENTGFNSVPRPDTSDWNFVMGDRSGHEVDLHVVVFDSKGDGLYGAEGKEVIFPPAGSLYDDGMINGHKVSCLTRKARRTTAPNPGAGDFRSSCSGAVCKWTTNFWLGSGIGINPPSRPGLPAGAQVVKTTNLIILSMDRRVGSFTPTFILWTWIKSSTKDTASL